MKRGQRSRESKELQVRVPLSLSFHEDANEYFLPNYWLLLLIPHICTGQRGRLRLASGRGEAPGLAAKKNEKREVKVAAKEPSSPLVTGCLASSKNPMESTGDEGGRVEREAEEMLEKIK